MNRYKNVALAIGLSLLAMGAQAAGNLISNGDFTLGNTENAPSDLGYWWGNDGSPAITGGLDGNAELSDGDYIYQSFDIARNTTYVLTFTSTGLTGNVDLYDIRFLLNDGSTTEKTFAFGAGSHRYTFSTGAINQDFYTHLEFFAQNSTFSVDNISVMAAVPEPESWAMLLVGLAGIGGLARRRKVAQATG